MDARRSTLLYIALVATLHSAFFIWYQRSDWDVAWTDQGGYRMLANGLRESGAFTRYPHSTPFVPEAIRTPGYPGFVSLVFRAAGDSHLAVAIVQAALFVLVCWMVYAIAGRYGSERVARAAAFVTACFPPLPYFGALIMTELWTTFTLTAAILATLEAFETNAPRWFVLAGFCYGYTALSRPVFVLMPFFLAAGALPIVIRAAAARRLLKGWALLLAAFVVTLLPWFAYNYCYFHRVTISAAGGIGRPVWEASWQGVWPGRVQAALTELADQPTSDAEMADAVRRLAESSQLNSGPMITYVRQWRDIRQIWMTPQDPDERSRARIAGDATYLRVGLSNVKRDPAGYLKRRLARGLFVLWAAEIPVRYTDIARLPPWAVRAMWLPQLILLALGAGGLFVLWQCGNRPLLLVLGMPLVYVTVVHFFLLTEARQSLPVKPLLLSSAMICVVYLATPASIYSTRARSPIR